jgi:hypothetical protein
VIVEVLVSEVLVVDVEVSNEVVLAVRVLLLVDAVAVFVIVEVLV